MKHLQTVREFDAPVAMLVEFDGQGAMFVDKKRVYK
jgi:hypothetical protein